MYHLIGQTNDKMTNTTQWKIDKINISRKSMRTKVPNLAVIVLQYEKKEKFVKNLWWNHQCIIWFDMTKWPIRPNDKFTDWTKLYNRLYPKHISEIDADKRAKFGCNSSAIWKKEEKFEKTLWWIHQFTYQFNMTKWPKRPNDNLTKWHIWEIDADKRAKFGCNSSAK